MSETPSHETPIYVTLPGGMTGGAGVAAFLAHAQVRHHALPPLWGFDRAGIDVPAALPDEAAVTRDNVAPFLDRLTQLCDAEALDRLVARMWHEVGESVRDHYLQRTTMETFAAIFKVRPRSVEETPPPAFRADRIHENGFEVQYRLAAEGDLGPTGARLAEASLVYYPFDPANAAGRVEGNLGEGEGVVFEVFPYAPARARHRDVLQTIGRAAGWTVTDPLEGAPAASG